MLVGGGRRLMVVDLITSLNHPRTEFGILSDAEMRIEVAGGKHRVATHAEIARNEVGGAVAPAFCERLLRKEKRGCADPQRQRAMCAVLAGKKVPEHRPFSARITPVHAEVLGKKG